jgi:amino acid transporter
MALLLATPLFFAGFNAVPQALGESSEGARAILPKVIAVVILASMIFKVGVILATGLVLSGAEASAAEVPVALAFERAFGSKILSIAALLTGLMGLVTTWNAALFAGSRVLFAMGHARLGPSGLGRIGLRAKVPYVSIAFVSAVSLLAVPLGREILVPVISLGGICVTLMMVLVSCCLWKGRMRQGGRRYGLPAICLAISLGLLGLMFNELADKARTGSVIEIVIIAAWTVLGLVFWTASRRQRETIDAADREFRILGAGAAA